MQSLKTGPNCTWFGFEKSATMMGYVLTAFLSYVRRCVEMCVEKDSLKLWRRRRRRRSGLCGDMLCWLLNCVERWCRGWGEKELLPCRLLMATRSWRYVLACRWYPAQLTVPLIIPQLWRKPAVTNLIMYVCLHSSPLFPLSSCLHVMRLQDCEIPE